MKKMVRKSLSGLLVMLMMFSVVMAGAVAEGQRVMIGPISVVFATEPEKQADDKKEKPESETQESPAEEPKDEEILTEEPVTEEPVAEETQPEAVQPATLDIRAAADSESELLITVPADTEMEMLGREGDWVQVKVGDVTGYAFSPVVPETEVPDAPVEEPQPEAVQPATLDIYATADNQSELLLTVPADTEMEILSREGDWIQVKVGDVTGYAFSPAAPETTEATETEAPVETYFAHVAEADGTGTINVYAAASADSGVIAQLLSGSAVTVLGVEGEFAKINVKELTGYVRLAAVAPAEQNPETLEQARAAYIVIDIPENVRLGDVITMSCVLEGYDGIAYRLQWESAATDWDGNVTGDWQAADGANDPVLSVELTESSIFTAWRVQIELPDDGQQ